MNHDEKKAARPRGTDSAEVIQVIVTRALEGAGTEEDPCRIQEKYWSLDGRLLALGISHEWCAFGFSSRRDA